MTMALSTTAILLYPIGLFSKALPASKDSDEKILLLSQMEEPKNAPVRTPKDAE